MLQFPLPGAGVPNTRPRAWHFHMGAMDELRLFGSSLPTESLSGPRHMLTEGAEYLGTADNPLPPPPPEGALWCSHPQSRLRKPGSCICPQALEPGQSCLDLKVIPSSQMTLMWLAHGHAWNHGATGAHLSSFFVSLPLLKNSRH